MPFDTGFRIYPWAEKLLAIRERPLLAYALALALVVVAIVVRLAVANLVGPYVPFITFFPAIILAALLGGLGPGILAMILSTVAAWYAFVPLADSFELGPQDAAKLGLFVFIGAANVLIAVLLNSLVNRLLIQQRNIRLLLDSASNGFLLVDGEGRIRLANAAVERLFGYKPDELAGREVEVLVPHDQLEAHRRQRRQFQDNPETRLMGAGRDLSGRRRDGTDFPVEIGLNPVGGEGKSAVLATVIDITARKKTEEMQRLVVRELQHRMRNSLAMVQAIADRTLREKRDIDEARTTLHGRIEALMQAYRMPQADGEELPLAQIIQRQVSAYGDRVVTKGCDVLLAPSVAQQFALVVHELSTNAVKHGSLSGPTGVVVITGQVKNDAEPVFLFRWEEQGGPPAHPPTRTGFGTTVLRQAAQSFACDVRIDYRPEGLVYLLEIRLPELQAQNRRNPDVASGVTSVRTAQPPEVG
jgi:PAS domain S-box-containing protein